jgi:hypothetical protein
LQTYYYAEIPDWLKTDSLEEQGGYAPNYRNTNLSNTGSFVMGSHWTQVLPFTHSLVIRFDRSCISLSVLLKVPRT